MTNSLTILLLTIILALAPLPAPQTQKKAPPQEKTECGTVVTPEQVKAELAREAELSRNKGDALTMAAPVHAPYYLPLTIHMVLDSAGIQTGLSAEELEKVMQNLNQMWRPFGIQFFIYGDIDTSIRNDAYFNLPNTEASHDDMLNQNHVPGTINVYFTNLNGNLGGKATFTQENTQGILLDYTTMYDYPTNLYSIEVFAHEMGHFFDLYHTHETMFGVECPKRDNCSKTGDKLCDTPADPRLSQPGFVDNNCAYTGLAALPSGCDPNIPYTPLTTNLMSYARGECRTEFTTDQINKALQVLTNANNRKNLINGKSRYVDRLANASNNKCTYNEPCRTLTTAMQVAGNGDAIFLKSGPYAATSVGGKHVTVGRWGYENGVVLTP